MLINEQLVPTIEASDTLILETDTGADDIQVYRDCDGFYHVIRGGIARHPLCTPEDAMRALAQYLQSALYQTRPRGFEVRRMGVPADSGPIKGGAIADRMMAMCGCKGQYACSCPSVQNPATAELWGEHNRAKSLGCT